MQIPRNRYAHKIFNFVIASDFDFAYHEFKVVVNRCINDESINKQETYPKLFK